jgi:methionyl-tRNA formyltransferase
MYLNEFEPDIVICNNFTKLLPQTFIDFLKFTNPKIKIINIHHADLRIKTDAGALAYQGLTGEVKEILEEQQVITTIHYIEDDRMDEGKQLHHSKPTTITEMKQKGFLHDKEEVINFRVKNVITQYHERTKVLTPLSKIVNELLKK